VVQHGVVTRLVQIASCESSPPSVRVEATIILGSIAKGTEDHVRALVEINIMPILVKGNMAPQAAPKVTLQMLSCKFHLFRRVARCHLRKFDIRS